MPNHQISLKALGLFAGIFGLLGAGICQAQSPSKSQVLEVTTEKRTYQGIILKDDSQQFVMLRTNGRISTIPRSAIKTEKKLPGSFQPADTRSIRSELEKEFGKNYEVSMTRNFVVVHPIGERKKWVPPFEDMYNQFSSAMRARGFALDKPQFPMVVAVLNTREEFDRFLKQQNQADPTIQGYYSLLSNRVITYRPQDEASADFYRMTTLIHEATHQIAYNTGVHSRTATTPRWVAEGLATVFEAPGYNNGREHRGADAKVNKPQLAIFREYLSQGKIRGKLESLILSDEWFQEEPFVAYSYAWALSYYLAENKPTQYSAYLKMLGQRPDFEPYPEVERRRDFEKFFGKNFNDLELRMLKAVVE
ncbi:MAG: DUF1570 domain-containing protein [Pirellulaceae bacterium]|nr:DUF1570 domain-containing protein [Pirellulaceae bacterium]